MPELIIFQALLSSSLHIFPFDDGRLRRWTDCIHKVLSTSPSLDASDSSSPGLWTRCVTPPPSPCSPSHLSNQSAPSCLPPVQTSAYFLGPLPLDQQGEAGGYQGYHGHAMVTFGGRNPLAMSSVTPPEGRLQGSNFTPHHYKPFSSHEHYQQVMCALQKLQQSGFYWGAISGREANSLLRSHPPGTFLVRDSSDHHYFFTLSVQTIKGTKNLRIHSEGGGFFLQADPQNTQELPKFDCVLKLIEHYMEKGQDTERTTEGASGGNSGEAKTKAHNVYLIDSGGEKIPLKLRRPLMTSLSSLQHMCRRTLNNQGPRASEQTQQLPDAIRDFLQEYDSPI